jgi:hypothetical protein
MAKKQGTKKFDTPDQNQPQTTEQKMEQMAAEVPTEQSAPVGNGEQTEASTLFVAKPQLYLQDENGTQYQFTRFAMPKRAEKNPDGEMKIELDGEEIPVWLTSSKGWAADDARIDYIWFYLDKDANQGGYITLDYGVDASTYNDVIFTSHEGKANRENPKRVPRDPAKEENRKAQFTATMAKKATEPKPGENGTPEQTTQPADEQPQQSA